MEPILTNHALVDETVIKKGLTRTLRPRRCLFWADAALLTALGVFALFRLKIIPYGLDLLYGLTFHDSQVIQALVPFGLAALCVWFGASMTGRYTRLALRRMAEQYQATSYEADYTFFADSFTFRSTVHPNETQLAYASVKQLLLCDDLILLISQAKLIYTLDRTRFENGTEADFWRLMNEKCPQAVPKKFRQPTNH